MKKLSITTLTLALGLALMPLSLQAATENAAKTTTPTSVEKSASKDKKVDQSAVKESSSSVEKEKVSINNASAEELAKALNGVGLKKGQTIVEYREQMGPFTKIDQLQEVPGIGPALYQRNQSRLKL